VARLKRFLVMAVLGSAAVVVLLFIPSAVPPGSPIRHAMGSTLHVLLFAALAFLWARVLPSRLRGGWLWGVLAVAAALMEWLQPIFGRSAELGDWLYGVGGAACICGSASLNGRKGLRWLLLCLLASAPLVWTLGMHRLEARAFPVLADPDALWSHQGWSRTRVRLTSDFPEFFCVKQDAPKEGERDIPYPGLFRHPACADWSTGQAFQARLFWPGVRPAVMAVRWDDRLWNPPYGDRFQVELSVTQGWNSIVIPLDASCQTPGGRPLQMDSIKQWGVFLVSSTSFDYFLLDAVRLELQEEKP